jgi:cell wall-associated NlpC family hydrolase
MRRIALLACSLALLVAAGTAGAQATVPSWATPQIKAVVEAGLMAPSVAEFRPDEPLTSVELAVILASLGSTNVTSPDPDRPVTIRELDARLVTVAGLRPAGRDLRTAAVQAGLAPRQWFGTEAVARLLGLRINHLRNQEHLELQPNQPATRAEAAYSLARLLSLDDGQLEAVGETLEAFSFPPLTPWQQTVLARATRFVGSPYVWAGTSERPQQLFGKRLPGGFDCSGLVWRVFKLQPFDGGPTLGASLKGRTTYDMSGEIAPSARLTREELQPGDLAFFGSRGARSKPGEVGHMGIYLGNGWIVHSSTYGTTLQPMTGWYDTTFAWGRSPLAEAGLS